MYATKQRTNMVAKIMTEAELLQRDLTLLLAVVQHGPIGLVRLSRKTGLPQHKVRYSLRILQQDGLIEPTPEGAIATATPPGSWNASARELSAVRWLKTKS